MSLDIVKIRKGGGESRAYGEGNLKNGVSWNLCSWGMVLASHELCTGKASISGIIDRVVVEEFENWMVRHVIRVALNEAPGTERDLDELSSGPRLNR